MENEGARRSAGEVRHADPLLVLLLTSSAAFYLYRYLVEPTRPGVVSKQGWWAFSDQRAYLVEARNLSHFTLPASHFLFGLGYPVAAVPFLWLGQSSNPWFLFDGAAFVIAAVASYVVADRLFGRVAAGIAGFGLVFATPLVVYCLTPWNSTVSLVALSGLLLLATSPKPARWHPYAAGALVAWGFAARYPDVFWLGAVGAVAALHSRSRGTDWRPLVAMGATAALLALPVFAAHWRDFGSPFTTPYSLHLGQGSQARISDEQAGAYDLGRVPRSAFGMFVSPYLLGEKQPGSPLAADMFWTLLALPGAVIALRLGRHRPLIVVVCASWIAAFLFYMSFRGTGAFAIQFGGLHYFKMWWPAATILSAGALTRIGSRRADSNRGPLHYERCQRARMACLRGSLRPESED